MAESEFRELHGDYVANSGQTISLRQYLDYYEPLGSALSRLPDGSGGPFVHQFTDGGGRTIGSMGWVVSAASKRFGAWTLWGMWTERAMPPVALPLFWPSLSDPGQTAKLVQRANRDADALFDSKRWPKLLKEVQNHRFPEGKLRDALKSELSRAWAVAPPYRHAFEVELTPEQLDLLPWLYFLGPVDPAVAQLQPSRFNGAGYQYILGDHAAAITGSSKAVDQLVDTAASDAMAGWENAQELRVERTRPPKRAKPVEKHEMRKPIEPAPETGGRASGPPGGRDARPPWELISHLVMLAILAWIAWNVWVIRKAVTAAEPEAAAPVITISAPVETVAPPPPPDTRVARLASALTTRPPRNIRIADGVLTNITEEKLGRVAIEIFLRRNACHPRTEAVDGKFSTNEQRAIRNCAVLQDERLMKSALEPDHERAFAWLERVVAP